MGSDIVAAARRAVVPFLAGVTAALALSNRLYATATLSLLVALWTASLIQQAVGRRQSPATAVPPTEVPAYDDEERRRLSLYLDLSPAPLVALDAQDRLHAVNRAARRLLGADDLVIATPAHLTAAIAATPPGRSASVRIDTGTGEHAFALLTADLDSIRRSVRVAALVDIEADLKATETATLRDLLQVLSHEITNTLTPIASLSATAVHMLTEEPIELGAVRDAVATVARRAEGLQRFGEAYRDLARLPPPTLAPVDLHALIADLGRMFRTRWPCVTLGLANRLAAVQPQADGDQLAQAIWAVMSNAAEVADTVDVTVDLAGGAVIISVSDNGPGIAAEDATAIFQPFFTTKHTGTGVGLTLARQVFRAHGGDLIVSGRSDQSRGSVFKGSLPL